MTEPDEPATLERGRYRVLGTPDGGLIINRAAGLCERCEACGCGDPAEPIGPVPGAVLAMLKKLGAGNGGKLPLPGPAEMMKLIAAVRSGPKDEADKAMRRVRRG